MIASSQSRARKHAAIDRTLPMPKMIHGKERRVRLTAVAPVPEHDTARTATTTPASDMLASAQTQHVLHVVKTRGSTRHPLRAAQATVCKEEPTGGLMGENHA